MIPISLSSARTSLIAGSSSFSDDFAGADAGGGGGGGAAGAGEAGAGECDPRCRKLPKSERPEPFPFDGAAGPWPRVAENGVAFVSLLACFSRSFIFFRKVLASFSSANENAAGHSSSSKV